MHPSKMFVQAFFLAGIGTAHAQYRCDCTTVVDTCNAEVTARGSFIEVRADERMCARVDYFVDGQPFVSLVVDGEAREDWLARTTSPRILVQSCQVCRDLGAEAAAASTRATTSAPARGAAGGERGLEPLIAGVPEYPAAARARALRGFVEVEFTVAPAGTVENAGVVESEPGTVFDAAALAAVARRRYPADERREPQVLRERIEFAPPAAGRAAVAPAVSGSGGPLNRCVREDAVYNYGDAVDVGLINACAEPLIVFGCAQGTGRNRGTWVCTDSETRGDILVPAGDERLGRRYTAGDAAAIRTYTYRDTFSVTRAPNTQLWFVACAETDEACRAAARLWTRGVIGQDAAINPQARSPIAVARSN